MKSSALIVEVWTHVKDAVQDMKYMRRKASESAERRKTETMRRARRYCRKTAARPVHSVDYGFSALFQAKMADAL
jgi:hypothetical protein